MNHVTVEQFKTMLLAHPLDETVQNHIFSGNPFAFRTNPSALTVLTNHLIEQLNVQLANTCVVGSGKMGFSLNPYNFPRPFSENSDIDVIVIDQLMFDTVWATLLKWHYPRRTEDLPGVDRKWIGDRKKDLYWGWFIPDKIKFEGLSFPTVLKPIRDISATWFNAFQSLSQYDEFLGRTVSGRLYRTWEHAMLYHVEGLRLLSQIVEEEKGIASSQ